MPNPASVEDSVKAVFSTEKNHQYGADFLEGLRENMREVSSRMGKSVLLAVLAAILFELLARAAVEKASIGPFEVKDLSLFRLALPVVIAYSFYEITLLVLQFYEFETAYIAAYSNLYEDAAARDLEYFVLLIMPAHFAPRTYDTYRHDAPSDLLVTMQFLTVVIVYLSVLAFLGYAYYIQFRFFHFGNIAVWITVVINAYFLASAFLLLRKAFRM